MPSSDYSSAGIDEVIQQLLARLFKTLEVASASHPVRDLTSLVSVTRALETVLNSDGIHDAIGRADLEARHRTMTELEHLTYELGALDGSQSMEGLFRPKIASRLRHFYENLESLTASSGGSARASQEFRRQMVNLRKAIEGYSLQSAENERVQEIHWRLEHAQKESDLLRAQLDSNQTELAIREERARTAELRAKHLDTQVAHLEAAFADLDHRIADYAETELKLQGLVAFAEVEKAEITKIRDDAQTLAADAADNVMAANYGTMANQHARKERFFRWAALALFSISTMGAFLIAWNVGWFGSPTAGGSRTELWSEVAKKLLVAGGIAGIGLYFSRLASHHRKIEVWSSSLGVQLKTLESYLSGIKDEGLKDAIRERFADLTFGGPPSLHSPTKGPDTKAVSELAAAMSTIIRP